MIDRAARNSLAEAVRALADGLITNDEFEDRAPRRSADPAVWEIFQSGAWFLYDDLHKHRLVGHHKLPQGARPEIARWVLFLKSDREYEWPPSGGVVSLLWFLAMAVTLGLLSPARRRHYRSDGDIEVWPFRKRSHYKEAIRRPAYFTGTTQAPATGSNANCYLGHPQPHTS